MAKYRNLTEEELRSFEPEFINYLVVNGIAADDWVKIKDKDSEKASKIVALFSDVIMESVLRKINYVEIRTKKYIQSIYFRGDSMHMVALSTSLESVNMSDFKDENFKSNTGDAFEIHTGEQVFSDTREITIFNYIQKGFEVSDGKLYKSLLLATVE